LARPVHSKLEGTKTADLFRNKNGQYRYRKRSEITFERCVILILYEFTFSLDCILARHCFDAVVLLFGLLEGHTGL